MPERKLIDVPAISRASWVPANIYTQISQGFKRRPERVRRRAVVVSTRILLFFLSFLLDLSTHEQTGTPGSNNTFPPPPLLLGEHLLRLHDQSLSIDGLQEENDGHLPRLVRPDTTTKQPEKQGGGNMGLTFAFASGSERRDEEATAVAGWLLRACRRGSIAAAIGSSTARASRSSMPVASP